MELFRQIGTSITASSLNTPAISQLLYLVPSILQIAGLITITSLRLSSDIDISNERLKNPYPTIGISVLGLVLYFLLEIWCNPERQVQRTRNVYVQRIDSLIPGNLAANLENERRQIEAVVIRNMRPQMQGGPDRPQQNIAENVVVPA
jgi:hypothetical protein